MDFEWLKSFHWLHFPSESYHLLILMMLCDTFDLENDYQMVFSSNYWYLKCLITCAQIQVVFPLGFNLFFSINQNILILKSIFNIKNYISNLKHTRNTHHIRTHIHQSRFIHIEPLFTNSRILPLCSSLPKFIQVCSHPSTLHLPRSKSVIKNETTQPSPRQPTSIYVGTLLQSSSVALPVSNQQTQPSSQKVSITDPSHPFCQQSWEPNN